MKPRISILLVDDLEKKQEAIGNAVRAKLGHFEVNFDYADRYETARDLLRAKNYDFVLLDLMIPAGEELASEKWSRQLLRDIVDGSLCYPMHVFGITVHSEVAEAERQYYEENLFGLFVFSWESDLWASSICAKINYLVEALQNGAAYRLNSYDYDVVILTARHETEFVPAREALFGRQRVSTHPMWPDSSCVGQLKLRANESLRAVMLCIGETGLAPAASKTSQAIQMLRPRMVVMVGMCAGFGNKGIGLMDVLVASETACWQEGKSLGGEGGERFDARAKIKTCSPLVGAAIDRTLETYASEVTALMEECSRTKEYLGLHKAYGSQMREQPSTRAGLVVSGSEIVASGDVADEVMRRHPTALGLEMEIYAVYTAARLALGKQCEFIAVKGVADLADPEKRDETQRLASALSAKTLKLILKHCQPIFGG